jgi:anti-sigma B factor antagonist
VALSFDSRRVGDLAVVRCQGRIVEGDESAGLRRHLDDLLPYGANILLDLSQVEFIDSSGLGLLVRFLTRCRAADGDLQLCGLSPRIREVLRVTKLAAVFESHETEALAIAAFYERPMSAGAPRLERGILCVDKSTDVLAYLRELLKQAGYAALTTVNLPDALTLLKATQPKLVVIGADLRGARDTTTASTFNALVDRLAVVELPGNFSSTDAGDAGRHVLDQVNAVMASTG